MRALHFVIACALFTGMIACGSKEATIENRIFDEAHVISDVQKDSLINAIRLIETNIGPRIAIMTVENLDGEKVEALSAKAAKAHGFDASKDVFFFVATTGHAAHIITGSEVEKVLDDPLRVHLIWDMAPKFNKQKYGSGLVDGVEKLKAVFIVNKDAISK
ncbi:MAG TPA: TPM domain-containing protein [Chryseolinea sp.]